MGYKCYEKIIKQSEEINKAASLISWHLNKDPKGSEEVS